MIQTEANYAGNQDSQGFNQERWLAGWDLPLPHAQEDNAQWVSKPMVATATVEKSIILILYPITRSTRPVWQRPLGPEPPRLATLVPIMVMIIIPVDNKAAAHLKMPK